MSDQEKIEAAIEGIIQHSEGVDWQRRAEKAEAENARLRKASRELGMLATAGWTEVERLREENDLLKTTRIDYTELTREVERLRAEDEDWRATFAVQAFTAPNADWATIFDSYKARHDDALAEVERLRGLHREALSIALEGTSDE